MGTGWGDPCGVGTERGYGWVDYDSNNIGYAATWVRAKSNSYVLPQKYFEVKPNIRPFLDDPGPGIKARIAPRITLPTVPRVRPRVTP